MASPHVAGAAALHLADNPSATPAQVSSALTSAATTGVVGNPGSGSPNRLLYVGDGGTTPPP
ncbi:S8 family serine peptidase, partial [Streptomyces viridosporus]